MSTASSGRMSPGAAAVAFAVGMGRGLHSFTFRLNLSTFCGIGLLIDFVSGVFRLCHGVLGGVKSAFCVRNGSS